MGKNPSTATFTTPAFTADTTTEPTTTTDTVALVTPDATAWVAASWHTTATTATVAMATAIADPKHPGNADYEPHSLGHKVLARKPWHHDHHGYDDFNGYGYYGRPYGYGRRGYGYYGHHAW